MGEIFVAWGEAPGIVKKETVRPRSNIENRADHFSDGMEFDLDLEV